VVASTYVDILCMSIPVIEPAFIESVATDAVRNALSTQMYGRYTRSNKRAVVLCGDTCLPRMSTAEVVHWLCEQCEKDRDHMKHIDAALTSVYDSCTNEMVIVVPYFDKNELEKLHCFILSVSLS
jgi:hypothetical protein